MKGLAYILTALAVFGLAFWAYRENYATKTALDDTKSLQGDIGKAQVRLGILRAEWAYLNRPSRLMELSEINFDRLGLLPFRPDQFGRMDEVSYPPDPSLLIDSVIDGAIDTAVDVSTMNQEQFP